MDEVCRICMDNSVALVNIFDDRPSTAEEPSLADMLKECAGCNVQQDDVLPKLICDTCVLDCLNAFRFKRTCEQTQELFMELLCEGNVNCETSDAKDGDLLDNSLDLDCIKVEDQSDALCSSEEVFQKTVDNGIVSLNTELTLYSGKSWRGKTIPMNDASALSGKIYRCQICSKEFLHLDKLAKHKHLHNDDFRPFKCRYCPITFARRSLLNAHLHNHTDKRPHKCPYCPKSFSRKLNAQEHMLIHTGKFPYECADCKKTFKSMPGFRNHICLPAHNELRNAPLSLYTEKS